MFFLFSVIKLICIFCPINGVQRLSKVLNRSSSEHGLVIVVLPSICHQRCCCYFYCYNELTSEVVLIVTFCSCDCMLLAWSHMASTCCMMDGWMDCWHLHLHQQLLDWEFLIYERFYNFIFTPSNSWLSIVWVDLYPSCVTCHVSHVTWWRLFVLHQCLSLGCEQTCSASVCCMLLNFIMS
jgi:hypothetical protein